MSNTGKKKKKRLVRRLVTLVMLSMVIVLLLVLVSSTVLSLFNHEQIFNNKSLEVAKTVSEFVDAEYIEKLQNAVEQEEFIELRAEADETGDVEPIEEWMIEQGLNEDFLLMNATLEKICVDMDVSYIYIQSIENGKCTTLLDPNETYYTLGVVDDLAGTDFESIKGNETVEPTLSYSEYGFLSSGGVPIFNEDGQAVAISFCDVDATETIMKTLRFSSGVGILGLLFVVIVGLWSSGRLRRKITNPIEMLTQSTVAFGTEESGYKKENIRELDIRTKDEIEELYHATHDMQESIIDYMDNLTAITAEKERIGAELDVATRIQASMLPNIYPAFPDRKEFDIYASMNPAKEVGGDFYDYFLIDEDHLGLVIADVSGKGVPAALFMMMSKIIISNYAQMNLPPAEVLKKTNESICISNEEGMFVTVWFGIMTISTGHVVAGNAGHEYPMIRKANGDFELFKDKHNLAIGAMDGIKYGQYEFDIEKGGTLFIYTDGCAEATNASNEMFGMQRMLDALNQKPEATPRELIDNMIGSVDEFVGEAPQFDDLTMLAITVK